jgi:hypothetical protein
MSMLDLSARASHLTTQGGFQQEIIALLELDRSTTVTVKPVTLLLPLVISIEHALGPSKACTIIDAQECS